MVDGAGDSGSSAEVLLRVPPPWQGRRVEDRGGLRWIVGAEWDFDATPQAGWLRSNCHGGREARKLGDGDDGRRVRFEREKDASASAAWLGSRGGACG